MLFKKTLREKAFAKAIVDNIVLSTIHYMAEFYENIHKALANHNYKDEKLLDENLDRLRLAAIVLDIQAVHGTLGPYAFANIRQHILKRIADLDLMMSAQDFEQSFYRYQEACDSARDRGVLPVGHDPLKNENLSAVLYDEMRLPYVTLSGGLKAQSPLAHLAIVDFFQNVTGITRHMLENYKIKR